VDWRPQWAIGQITGLGRVLISANQRPLAPAPIAVKPFDKCINKLKILLHLPLCHKNVILLPSAPVAFGGSERRHRLQGEHEDPL
jgi:hypothetical protein